MKRSRLAQRYAELPAASISDAVSEAIRELGIKTYKIL